MRLSIVAISFVGLSAVLALLLIALTNEKIADEKTILLPLALGACVMSGIFGGMVALYWRDR